MLSNPFDIEIFSNAAVVRKTLKPGSKILRKGILSALGGVKRLDYFFSECSIKHNGLIFTHIWPLLCSVLISGNLTPLEENAVVLCGVTFTMTIQLKAAAHPYTCIIRRRWGCCLSYSWTEDLTSKIRLFLLLFCILFLCPSLAMPPLNLPV